MRKARRSSADKKNSKLLELHSPLKSWSSPKPNCIDCSCAVRRCKKHGGCHQPSAKRQLRCLFLYVFARGFLFNPQFDHEPDYIIRKPRVHRIPRYILRREIVSTFHTRVDNRSIRHFCILFTRKLPLPLRRSPPKSSTPLPSPTPLTTPNGIPIHLRMSSLLTCADRQMVRAKVP